MPPTDDVSPETVFANLLLPLKRANQRRSATYFSLGPDRNAETYWGGVVSRTGGVTQVKFDETTDALHSLEAYWSSRGENLLSKTLPELRALQETILAVKTSTRDAEQSVPEFVYPLY